MNGIIILDKPEGRTSHDMVYIMRKLTGEKKVGHTGTLDPMASGVLPICVGSATKAADMLTLSDKRYTAEITFGAATDTQDSTGTVIKESRERRTDDEIRAAVSEFVGDIEQIPPMYSAVKKNGRKLYELARQGIETERAPRRVTIYSARVVKIDFPRAVIDVSCSKGAYIRTLCADIGERLGIFAHMSALRRTKTGMFTIEESRTPDELREMSENGALCDALIPTDALFSHLEEIHLNAKQSVSVTNGVRMTYRGEENKSYRVYDGNGEFLCVSKIVDGRLMLVKSFWT